MKLAVFSFLLSSLSASVSAGYTDKVPPLSQPNDIDGTVNGCADAIMAHDNDGDGAIRRDEYLDFVNNVADLLCLPPRPVLDLELQTVFVSVACLCREQEGNDASCCFDEQAGLYLDGAASAVGRTEEEHSYLRAACLLTQAVLGPEQCELPTATLSPDASVPVGEEPPLVATGDQASHLLWVLLLLLVPLCCLICCCCRRNDKNEGTEEYNVTVEEHKIVEQQEQSESRYMTRSQDVEQPPEEAMSVFGAGDSSSEEEKENASKEMGSNVEDGEDSENVGKSMGATQEDGEEEGKTGRFDGQGLLPNPSDPECILLRHVVTEEREEDGHAHIRRDIHEFKYTSQESGQVLSPYTPEGGVHQYERPAKESTVMPKPEYRRQPKAEAPYRDPRVQRIQMGLGDGEVWGVLAGWEDEDTKKVHARDMDWVIDSTRSVCSCRRSTGAREGRIICGRSNRH